MTNDEILQAAKEAGLGPIIGNVTLGDAAIPSEVCLQRFAAIIEKRTIERCAVAADAAYATDEVIAAIRKLGEQK